MTERTDTPSWAVVTGGSKGIGYAVADRLAAEGHRLVLVARDKAALETAADILRSAHPATEVQVYSADLARPADITGLFSWLDSAVPHLNVFVANAGYGRNAAFLDLTPEEWAEKIDLNLTGTFLCLQAAARRMVRDPQDNMALVAVSSIRATGVRPGRTAYAVSKAGLNQLVRSAAAELGPYRIRLNAVSPGITNTPLVAEYPDEVAAMRQQIPLGRLGEPTDMAAAAAFLCGPAAAFITGANLVVDGGESLAS